MSWRVAVHLAVDDVGQVSFEGADGFHRRHAFGAAAPVVGPAGGVVAELDDWPDVQDPRGSANERPDGIIG
jgi:hypothetical protein